MLALCDKPGGLGCSRHAASERFTIRALAVCLRPSPAVLCLSALPPPWLALLVQAANLFAGLSTRGWQVKRDSPGGTLLTSLVQEETPSTLLGGQLCSPWAGDGDTAAVPSGLTPSLSCGHHLLPVLVHPPTSHCSPPRGGRGPRSQCPPKSLLGEGSCCSPWAAVDGVRPAPASRPPFPPSACVLHLCDPSKHRPCGLLKLKPGWSGGGGTSGHSFCLQNQDKPRNRATGKYTCHILTIFIHRFYCNIYYKKFCIRLPSAQTQAPTLATSVPSPSPAARGWLLAERRPYHLQKSGPGGDSTAHDRDRATSPHRAVSC